MKRFIRLPPTALDIVVLAAALVATASASAAPPAGQAGAPRPNAHLRHVRIVAIDPGHGGSNRGCLGVDGTWEKDAVLAIARRVERILLSETTATPMLTRRTDRDLGLRERSRMANAWRADLLLSLHLNADEPGNGRGVEVWFGSEEPADDEARRILALEEAAYDRAAEGALGPRKVSDPLVAAVVEDAAFGLARADSEVLAALLQDSLHRATGARSRGIKQAPFTVLLDAEMPAVVIELGFFTHRDEGMKLVDPDYQEVLARAIVEGIIRLDRRIGGERPPTTSQLGPEAR